MIITIEISMYPFQSEYRPLIGDFIHQLNHSNRWISVRDENTHWIVAVELWETRQGGVRHKVHSGVRRGVLIPKGNQTLKMCQKVILAT